MNVPGVGKTAIAYHCAAVAAGIDPSIHLLDVSCTSLVHKEVGGSERSVHKMFEAARAASPCILLLDGIENIAQVRGNDNTTEGTMDRILSTLLIEMDGIGPSSNNNNNHKLPKEIAVIGVTHDPSLIDPALRRPGRLNKCIHLSNPDMDAREEIIRQEICSIDIDFSNAGFFDPKNCDELATTMAMRTSGMTPAEVILKCQQARMNVIRDWIDGQQRHESEYSTNNDLMLGVGNSIIIPSGHFLTGL